VLAGGCDEQFDQIPWFSIAVDWLPGWIENTPASRWHRRNERFPFLTQKLHFVIAHDESSGPKVENVTIAINAAQPKTIFK